LPNSINLMLGLIFGSIGVGYFIYGKNTANVVCRYTGIALIGYPYFIENTWAILMVGVGLMMLPRFVDL